jgi:hypothetical protein
MVICSQCISVLFVIHWMNANIWITLGELSLLLFVVLEPHRHQLKFTGKT